MRRSVHPADCQTRAGAPRGGRVKRSMNRARRRRMCKVAGKVGVEDGTRKWSRGFKRLIGRSLPIGLKRNRACSALTTNLVIVSGSLP
jgi:hypothetical protein